MNRSCARLRFPTFNLYEAEYGSCGNGRDPSLRYSVLHFHVDIVATGQFRMKFGADFQESAEPPG